MGSVSESQRKFVDFLIRWHTFGDDRETDLKRVLSRLQAYPLLFSALEYDMLRVRLTEYDTLQLDALVDSGVVVWQGRRRLGDYDGYVALYYREAFPALAPIGAFADGDRECRIRDALIEQGPLEFREIESLIGGFPGDILKSIWTLVWNGEVSNTSLSPLRARHSSLSSRLHFVPRRFGNRRRIPPGSSGKWFLLSTPESGFSGPETRCNAQIDQCLAGLGVLCRETVQASPFDLNFDRIQAALNQRCADGTLIRGKFFDHCSTPQYLCPGTKHLIGDTTGSNNHAVLASTDPCNPFGGLLPWPDISTRLQRTPGTYVSLRDGELRGYLAKSANSLTTLTHDANALAWLARDLAAHFASEPLYLETVDGRAGRSDATHEALVNAGFSASPAGYLLRPRDRRG